MEQLPQFENWLKTRSYEDLDESEKKLVLQHMSAARYREMRDILTTVEADSAKLLQPDSVVRTNLELQLVAHLRGSRWLALFDQLRQLTSYRIPVWQPALGLIGLVLWYSGFAGTDRSFVEVTEQAAKAEAVVVYRTDTVYVPKPVTPAPVTRKVVSNQKAGRPSPKNMSSIAVSAPTGREILPVAELPGQLQIGRSAKDEADLMDLLVEIY